MLLNHFRFLSQKHLSKNNSVKNFKALKILIIQLDFSQILIYESLFHLI